MKVRSACRSRRVQRRNTQTRYMESRHYAEQEQVRAAKVVLLARVLPVVVGRVWSLASGQSVMNDMNVVEQGSFLGSGGGKILFHFSHGEVTMFTSLRFTLRATSWFSFRTKS